MPNRNRRLLHCLIPAALSLAAAAQRTVENPQPLIALSENRILYKFYDNPVEISTGNLSGLTITVEGGTLRKGKTPGQYFLRPDSTKRETLVTLRSGNYMHTSWFLCREIPFDRLRIRFIGSKGAGTGFRSLKGAYPYLRDFPAQFPFRVDWFWISRTRGDSLETHQNFGPLWDATVQQWFREVEEGTRMKVYKMKVLLGGTYYLITEEADIYLGENIGH